MTAHSFAEVGSRNRTLDEFVRLVLTKCQLPTREFTIFAAVPLGLKGGVWNGVGDWYFGPGCQYANPIGAGVIVCNGRLLLTLEAHASIARDSALPKELMDRWIAELGV
jgi:hypothetical protein